MRDYNLLRGLKGFIRQNLRACCGAWENLTDLRVCISMQSGIYCKDKRKIRDIIVYTICLNLANQVLFFSFFTEEIIFREERKESIYFSIVKHFYVKLPILISIKLRNWTNVVYFELKVTRWIALTNDLATIFGWSKIFQAVARMLHGFTYKKRIQ